MSVILHIGFHKTGTTSIQVWMRDHEAVLAEHGIRFPRGWLDLNVHFELPICLLRQDRMMSGRRRGEEWRDPNWRAHVLHQVAADLEAHRDEVTVLSAEDLCLFRYDDEIRPLRELVGDAEVIAYLRSSKPFRASLAAHLCKPGGPGLSDDPDAYNYLRDDSWRVDYETLLDGWQKHFTHVWTPSYEHRVARDGSVIPSFLARLGVPATPDVAWYRMNRRGDPVPKVEGNRAIGLRFGEVSRSHVVEDGALLTVP